MQLARGFLFLSCVETSSSSLFLCVSFSPRPCRLEIAILEIEALPCHTTTSSLICAQEERQTTIVVVATHERHQIIRKLRCVCAMRVSYRIRMRSSSSTYMTGSPWPTRGVSPIVVSFWLVHTSVLSRKIRCWSLQCPTVLQLDGGTKSTNLGGSNKATFLLVLVRLVHRQVIRRESQAASVV